MKNKKHIYIQFLKIVSLISLLFFNASIMYSQNEMEDAVVSLSFSEENDIKTIIATVIDQTGLPIEGLELYFYVQRTFSLLPIGDGFNETDESGVVEIEFPNDLPGDAEGNVTIVVKVTESDLYNDLALETIKNWGIPVLVDKAGEKRSLWATAANAPVSLITSVSLMIITIWYIIFYIVFKLYKISKIKPLKP